MKKIFLSQSRLMMQVVLLLVLFSITSSCNKSSETTSSNKVSIHNMAFSPSVITVPINTTVTWTNNDDTPHTVTSALGFFESGSLDSGEIFSFTFSAAGTYNYSCSIHSSMLGSVVAE